MQAELLSAPLAPLIIRKTLPVMLGILSIIFFNLVDTLFIAMLGTEALAGISFTFPVTFALTSIAMGLSTAVVVVVGQALGASDPKFAARFTRNSLYLALLVMVLISSLGFANIQRLFFSMGAELKVLPFIESYMRIFYLSIPLLVMLMVASAALRASGDTKTPSIIMLTSGILNGLLDPLFIFGLGPFPQWGVAGAAIASALSWSICLIACLFILKRRTLLVKSSTFLSKSTLSDWRKLLTFAIPACLSQLMAPLANFIILTLLASLGTHAIAAYGLASRIEALLLIGVMSISSVVAMLIGQNVGAGNIKRAQMVMSTSVTIACLWQLSLALIMFILGPWIASGISSDPQVIWLSGYYLKYVPFCYALVGVALILAQTLNALQKPIWGMLVNAVRLFALLVPAVYLSVQTQFIQLVFLSMSSAHLLAGIAALIAMLSLYKQQSWWQRIR
ncbi:MATE family efflux transporter [Alginatibacterium sediminis]|uniref:MATE family efflux transporter n=1 Tax=Alginatibacterium sediminis TaxID=2164068 RepID=UPI0013145613|nr:MATE family efflux transporter [Alginatibacterium sediminis]